MSTSYLGETTRFIHGKDHDEVLTTIDAIGDLADPQPALDAYFELLKLRDQAFPLLLRNGVPLMLERTPTYLYLLPALSHQQTQARWVLAQYPSVRNQLPCVELLEWRFSEGEARVVPFGSHPQPHVIETQSKNIYADISRRALSISSIGDDTQLLLTLQFERGRLIINAYMDSSPCIYGDIVFNARTALLPDLAGSGG